MGGKIPKKIKDKVYDEWLHAIKNEKIAKNNGVGLGTVSNIVDEASSQEEYRDNAFVRRLAVLLNENELELKIVAFAFRITKILENNGIDLNQLESVASDIAVFCYKNNLSVDRFIQIAVECLNLSSRLGISILDIPDYIIKGKEIIDNLEKQRQNLIGEKQRLGEELDTLTNKIREYGKEKQLIEQIEELNRQQHKRDEEISQYKEEIEFLKTNDVNRKLPEAQQDILRLASENARKDFELKTARHQLSQCQEMMIKLAGEDHAK